MGLATALGVSAGASPAQPGGVVGAAAVGARTISYHGIQLRVPASWDVVDLERQPRACVRFDRNAVYLGHPGAEQDCPAGLVGRTDTILIEPLDGDSVTRWRSASITADGGRIPTDVPATIDRQASIAVPAASTLISVTYGADTTGVSRVLGTARVTGAATPARTLPRPRVEATPGAAGTAPRGNATPAQVVAPGDYQGTGFDACAAPSSAAMDAWLESDYRAIGVYIGGGARACAQPNLTAGWVSRQAAQGWHLMPLYVGLQAPCSRFRYRIYPPIASVQGRLAAEDAVRRARALGLASGTVIYNDMEAFDTANAGCTTTVLEFLTSWTRTLRGQGYRSGVYSSANSGIAALASVVYSPRYLNPDHVFFARWNGVATIDEPVLRATWWSRGQRIKQYLGGHNETHGGVTINIDSDYLAVGRITPPSPPPVPIPEPPAAEPVAAQAQTRLVAAADGVVYRLHPDGTLSWNRETDPLRGSTSWVSATNPTIASGWSGVTAMAAAAGGVLYTVDTSGALRWYRHTDPVGGGASWAPGSGRVVSTGWGGYRTIFAGAHGAIYGVDASGAVHWYRHLDPAGGQGWWGGGSGQVVATGWGSVTTATSGADGTIYAVTGSGELRWYQHYDPSGGAAIWAPDRRIATGWGSVRQLGTAGGGVLYTVDGSGTLRWYRHSWPATGSTGWAAGSGRVVGRL